MKIVPDQVQRWMPGQYVTLGTDGFGRSDSRDALRRFFEVDRRYIAVTALKALADDGKIDQKTVGEAIQKYGIDPDKPDPVTL
jgi:pyruvate dehydrogenase E1 component